MEQLLHYVWKYKLYEDTALTTTNLLPVEVIDPGISNTNAGPDFFNAKIKIDGTLWAGGVEIHDKASDWKRHGHDKDKAYDAVILHVVGEEDMTVCRTSGEPIPQMILSVPKPVIRNIDWLLFREQAIPCREMIGEIASLHLSGWKAALLSERMERKTGDIFTLLEQYDDDWNEVFYIILSRSFGFGVNNDAFERLAKSLPFHYIRKQRNSHSQIESFFFGQAGMLDESIDDHYYRLLRREYAFLAHKYAPKPLDSSVFKSLRTRPANFPYLKIAQLAAIWVRYDSLFSAVLEKTTADEMKRLFRIPPSDYWKTHFHFRNTTARQEKLLGESALNILLINTVVPMLFAYGIKQNLPEYGERAFGLLEQLPPEKNMIVSSFVQAGIDVEHAGDSQALIQLKREYCEKKKCLYCRIGFRLLKQSIVVHPANLFR